MREMRTQPLGVRTRPDFLLHDQGRTLRPKPAKRLHVPGHDRPHSACRPSIVFSDCLRRLPGTQPERYDLGCSGQPHSMHAKRARVAPIPHHSRRHSDPPPRLRPDGEDHIAYRICAHLAGFQKISPFHPPDFSPENSKSSPSPARNALAPQTAISRNFPFGTQKRAPSPADSARFRGQQEKSTHGTVASAGAEKIR